MIAGSITTALAGLLLLGVWAQLRHATALLWWFAADTAGAIGIALVAAGPSEQFDHSMVVGTILGNDEAHRSLNGRPLNATVSAGVATGDPEATFETIFDAADQALYRAKDLGRNRVERTDRRGSADERDTIVRVA